MIKNTLFQSDDRPVISTAENKIIFEALVFVISTTTLVKICDSNFYLVAFRLESERECNTNKARYIYKHSLNELRTTTHEQATKWLLL